MSLPAARIFGVDSKHLEVDIEAAVLLIGRIEQMRQRRRIAGRARRLGDPERRQRLGRHDPGRDESCEALGQKRAERLRFPGLDIPRRPVVQQAETANVAGRLEIGIGAPISLPDPIQTPSSNS